MKITPRTNSTIKKIAALIFMLTLGMVGGAAIARADGVLTPQEERFGDSISDSLCDFVDSVGVTTASMTKAVEIIYRYTPAHMDEYDAVDIINYVISNHCPRHWPALVAFGEGARSYA